jgi:hypothetical protein
MAGKISQPPFNESMNNTAWPSFLSVKDTQDTLTKKDERMCIMGVLKCQQAFNWALPSFIVTTKIKPYDLLAIFGK